MPSNVKPPSKQPTGIVRPEDEIVWTKCRGSSKCEGNRAQVLLKKNEGLRGTWIQYVCMTCKRTFSIHL